MSRLQFRAGWYWISEDLKLCEISVQICNLTIGPLSHLNGIFVFPHDSICTTFIVMHNPGYEYSDTLSFVLLACFIL